MRSCWAAILLLLCLASCRCNMLRAPKKSAHDEPGSSEQLDAFKSQRLSVEGEIPCHITDDKKIRCESGLAGERYDEFDLETMNQDDYKAISSNRLTMLCGVTSFGHLNCIGRSADEKRVAKKLAALFESFDLDSIYLNAYDHMACGHDIDTGMVHCLPIPESKNSCTNGRKLELHEKAKNFSIGTWGISIVNARDEIEILHPCIKDRTLVFPDKNKFAKVYFMDASAVAKLVCGLTADHRAECREMGGATGFADRLPSIEANKWLSLSMNNVLICGISADKRRGHCYGNDVKPANYDESVRLPQEELIDIKVGQQSVFWQTKSGVFSSVRYIKNNP